MSLWHPNGVRWQIWWQTVQLIYIYRYHFLTLTISLSFWPGKKMRQKLIECGGERVDTLQNAGLYKSLRSIRNATRKKRHEKRWEEWLQFLCHRVVFVGGRWVIIISVMWQNTQVTCSKTFHIISSAIKIVLLSTSNLSKFCFFLADG